jgi:hypothetical protein
MKTQPVITSYRRKPFNEDTERDPRILQQNSLPLYSDQVTGWTTGVRFPAGQDVSHLYSSQTDFEATQALVLQADTKVSEEHTASTFTNTNVV